MICYIEVWNHATIIVIRIRTNCSTFANSHLIFLLSHFSVQTVFSRGKTHVILTFVENPWWDFEIFQWIRDVTIKAQIVEWFLSYSIIIAIITFYFLNRLLILYELLFQQLFNIYCISFIKIIKFTIRRNKWTFHSH